MRNALFTSVLVLTLAWMAMASEPAGTADKSPAGVPVVSKDASWIRPVVGGIVLLFVVAAVAGPMIRARMAVEPPAPAPHDEPQVVSHH